jgi:hypothetical protein
LSDQNFEIAILFSILKSPHNYAFGDNMTHHSYRGNFFNLKNLSVVNV